MISHPPSRPAAGGLLLPVAAAPVRAGFPSPADDYLDDAISLDGYLISDPAATFLVRVRGDSMRGAGIDEGDLLVVDKGLTANHGDIVIAVVDGEFTVKRLHNLRGRCALIAENPAYPPIRLADGQELEVWGVVRGCVKRFR
ncbi:translesion error-prone DNA polymerase V autoproteolytic subunit [Chromobacterium haemolyticum]|uniref:Translesion error-prone DNA polymerase V autoproteolytic subunit n=1 Tax=Chromobacterium fluminis TaxID=3044269 RepID=A0ABX0LGF6_9NEIS|nr:translesion error-prone DNA polymerase V autoproteolytic subunit [Chromobacterium haemolyticum]NHR08308.1 translesion error-prone DNA polymerase V autoproteolytic subunit [Chromobacterium haemolyticum]